MSKRQSFSMDMKRLKLGCEVKRARQRLGFTLVQVASRIDGTHSMLSQLENGKHLPGAELLTRIAIVLGVHPSPWLAIAGHTTLAELLEG